MSAALRRALGAAGPGPAPAPALVLGPARSGRSALLFRAALGGPRALFLAPRPLQRLPGAGRGESDRRGLQRIQFLYPPSLRELLRLLASLHQSLPGPPALLLLDGLEHYLAGCPGPQAAARLSALLVDTASYFTGRLGADPRGPAPRCQLVASLRVSGESDGEDPLCILQRYFPAQCWLGPDSPAALGQDCGGARMFTAHLSQPGAPDLEWRLEFGLDGEMRVSPVPGGGEEDPGAALDTDRASRAEK